MAMVCPSLSRTKSSLATWVRRVRSDLRRKVACALIYALLFTFLPWTPPELTRTVERALQDAPASVQRLAPLALTITGWADEKLSALAPAPVYAGTNITMVVSKRDDGDDLGESVGPDPVAFGETLVYYVEITNTGSVSATVVFSDVLPSELECAGTPGAVVGYEGGLDTVWGGRCSNGVAVAYTSDILPPPVREGEGLPAGGHAVLYVETTLRDLLPDGYVFTNTRSSYVAYATQEMTYTYPGRNDVTTTVRAPRLAIAKTAWPDPVEAGSEVTFTLAVSNSGRYALTFPFTLTIVDRFPPETSYVRHTDFPDTTGTDVGTSVITWTIPFTSGGNADLVPGEMLTATLVVTVDVPFTHTYHVTNATYSVSIVPTDIVTPTSASGPTVDIEVSSHPALTITKGDAPDPVYASQDWTYWITVTNAADAQGNAVGLVITDRVPISTVLRSVSYEVAGTTVVSDGTAAGSTITWTLPAAYSLSWNESTHVSFTVGSATSVVISPTVITNAVYGAMADNALAGVSGDPITTTLWGAPHLQAQKSVQPSAIAATSDSSDVVTFTITVTNLDSATADATGVIITDRIPLHTELLSAGFASGTGTVQSPSSAAGSTITWTVADALAPTESVVVTFTVHISTPVDDGTVIHNQAFALASEGVYTASNQVDVLVSSTPSLHISKSDLRDPVSAGETISYTILYTNAGTTFAAGVVLSDTLPDHIVGGWASVAPDGGTIAAGATVTWDLGVVPGTGTTGTVRLYLTTASPLDAPVAVTNRVTIAATGGFSATASATTNIDCSPDITIAKAVDQGTAVPGGVRTYTIHVTNTGNQNAAGPVVITDLLPAELTVAGMVPSAGSVVSDVVGGQSAITWTLPSLAGEGGSAQLALDVGVTRPLTNGFEIANTAWVSHGASVTASEQVTFAIVSAPYLEIAKSGPSQARPSDLISYTITITNVGTEAAYGVCVTDAVPISTTFDGASHGGQETGGVVSWTLDVPVLDVGYTRVLTVRLDTPLDDGTQIVNTAWVSHGSALTESNEVVVTVVSTPTLHVVKVADPDPFVSAGGLLTYTITYSNSGDMTATGVVVTDTVDANVTVVDTIPVSDSLAGPVIVWALPPLVPGMPGQITVVVRVTDTLIDSSVIANAVEIGSDQGAYASVGPVTTTVRASDVAVSKGAAPAVVRAGEMVTYTILFTNVGGVAASNVAITDDLPVSLTLVSSDTVGAVFAGVSGSSYGWTAGAVPLGGGGAITITAQVTTAGGWLDPLGVVVTNVVTVATPGDNSPGNDADGVPVLVIAGPAATVTVGVFPSIVQVPGPATVAVTVTDQYGNLVANGDEYTVTLSGSSPALGFAPVEIGIFGGVGTADVTATVAATYDVTAALQSDGTISDTAPVTFTGGNLDHFIVSTISTQTAGISFTVDVTAVDAYSNVVVGFSGSVPLADSALPDTLQPPTTGPFVNGVLIGQDVTITLARVGTPIVVGTGLTQTASNPFTVVAGQPSTISVTPGLTDILLGVDVPVTTTVRDAYGNLVPGTVLTFGVSLGTALPLTDVTTVEGWASADVSSTVIGPATIVVTASNQVTGSALITFVAGYPAAITVTIIPSYTSVDNTAVITAEVVDAYGYPVTWGSIALDASGLGTGAIVPPTASLGAGGLVTATISSSELGLKTVIVTATVNGQTGTGMVTFTVGAPRNVVVTMSPDPQVVAVDATLVATVTDQYGHPVPGEVITFSVTTDVLGGGGIAPPTGTTAAQGAATTAISSTVATGALVTATVASNPAVLGTATVAFVAAAPADITVTVSPASVDGGVDATLVATVTDRFGNLCPGIPVTFTSDPLGGGGLWPQVSPTDVGGVATAQISGTMPGPVVITATVSPVVSDTTVLTITSDLLDHLEVSAVPDLLTAGANFTLVITAVDALGNPRTDGGLVTISDATGTVAPTTVSLTNGTATVVLSITMAMVDDQVTLVLDAPPGITGATNLFTVTVAAPFAVALTATPGSINPGGDTSTLVATVEDAYGNPIPGLTVDFAQVAGPAVTLTPVSGTADINGQVTVTLTSGVDQGTATIEATGGGVTGTVDVEISIYLIYLPLVLRNYTGIDLLPVGTIDVIPVGDGEYEIQVTLENAGPDSLEVDFWVDLYIDPDPTVPVGLNVVWNDVCTYGKAWFVRQNLAPGQQVVLSTNDPDDPSFPSDRYSNWPGGFDSAGPHELWVMVDSYGAPSVGAVIEYNEGNNILGPVVYVATTAAEGAAGSAEPIDQRPMPAP
jgi:uncharacterized repeat protein (TIGR01451 family)